MVVVVVVVVDDFFLDASIQYAWEGWGVVWFETRRYDTFFAGKQDSEANLTGNFWTKVDH